jgi:ABC-type glycerol-3-phosphate transport system substrate-binding protein
MATGAPVTIKFWRHDNTSYRQADDDAFADYTKAHPNVNIVPTTLTWFTYTGGLTSDLKMDHFDQDLVLMPPSVVCTYADNLLDVPADVASLSEAQNTFFAPPLQGSTCKNNTVLKGLPVEYNLEYGGVIVNMDKYQAKFPGKTPGWATWDEFMADAKALAEFDATGKPCVNGLDIDTDWPEPARHILLSMILQRGGKYWNDTGDLFNLMTPEAHDSLQEMVNWITVDKIMSVDLAPAKNTFVTGRVVKGYTGLGCGGDATQPLSAMGYAGTWAVKDALVQVPAGTTRRIEYYPLPPMIGTEHKFVQNAGFAFAVPKTTKYPQVAWDIAKSIALSADAMRKWTATAGTLPALRANGTPEAVASDPLLTRVQPLLDHGQWMGYIPAASTQDVLGAMVTNYFAAVKGEKTIDQALKDMQDTANAAIMADR